MTCSTTTTVLLAVLCSASAWQLYPLVPDSALVSHLTLCGTRAILSVTRQSLHQLYSLLDAPWPERTIGLPLLTQAKPFPFREPQTLGNCSMTQAAASSAWDGRRFLFVLDAGWSSVCPPKILVFDMITNQKVTSLELPGALSRPHLSSLVVDVTPLLGPRAYIWEAGSDRLIVFDLRNKEWREIYFSQPVELSTQPLSAAQLALSSSSLYLASNSTDTLFRVDLTALRNSLVDAVIKVEKVGSLLGPPSGLVADRQELYYCLARDYVCLSWNTQLPLKAESHEVLLQSAELLPHVHQLFIDFQRQVWALTDLNNRFHCLRLSGSFPYKKLYS